MVDKNITMADLKGTLEVFVKNCTARIPLFASDRTTSHSPEPSAPSWTFSASTAMARMQPVQGRGLDRNPRLRNGTSKGADQLRHRPGGIQRLAFGMGLERMVMIAPQHRRPAPVL